jgi:hypothetical protein
VAQVHIIYLISYATFLPIMTYRFVRIFKTSSCFTNSCIHHSLINPKLTCTILNDSVHKVTTGLRRVKVNCTL